MVKILLDPSMYHPHLTVAEELQKAADLGYQYVYFHVCFSFYLIGPARRPALIG